MATKKVKRYDGEDGSLTSSDASNNADSIRAAQEEIYMPDSSTKAPAQPTQRRTPTVTKEQLDASGLSLRDYMNKQLGLTRRDGSAPPSTPASKPAKNSNSGNENRRSASTPTATAAAPDYNAMAGNKPLYPAIVSGIKGMLADRQKRLARDSSSYAKGGSISSASSRGDGIASKGKTRGKMC